MREILLTAAALWLGTQNSEAGQDKGKSKAAPLKLKTTEFPDGTGSIGLAPGWQLSEAYRGTCVCRGPGVSGIVMGMGQPIMRPDHPVTNMPETPASWPRARDGDLGGAIRSLLERGNARVLSLRSRRVPSPSVNPGAPAGHFLYEYQRSDNKRITSLGYFTVIGRPDSYSSWSMYSSYMSATSERFMQDLPTMMAIYNSWRRNDNQPKAGSESAQMDAVIRENYIRKGESMKAQRESFERMQAKFKETF